MTARPPSSSYRDIFKATALLGGTQVAQILIGMVRTKVMAVLLGPAFMGLAGMYQSITGVVGTVTNLGMNYAGIRRVAEAQGSGDPLRVARAALLVRRMAWISGLLGLAIVLAFCGPITRATFGDDRYFWGVAVVSLSLLFGTVTGGQGAVLQGLRRTRDLAATQLAGAGVGTVAGIALVYLLRERAIAIMLVVSSGFAVWITWWLTRRIALPRVSVSFRETFRDARGLLEIGLACMLSSLLAGLVGYVSRVWLIRELGMNVLGLYTASITLSNLYIGVILNAMGMDFYPRLSAVATDNAAVNRLVNEQTEMGILIATPGIVATLVFAPWILRLLYSAEFMPAAAIIRWQVLGVAVRVVCWPMIYILLAKGAGKLYMALEIGLAAVSLFFFISGIHLWGMEGIGIAYLLQFVAYTLGLLLLCGRMSRFGWSRQSGGLMAGALGVIGLALFVIRLGSPLVSLAWGAALTVATLAASYGLLKTMMNLDLWAMFRKRLLRP